MNPDSELLRRYLDQKSEPAFAELVQRHIGLVYSVALRRVGGDAHLAEDVTQKVFSDLARKASTLRDRATLAGWLYAGTHLASAAVVRGERRRKARESEAHLMQTTLASTESDADWTRIRPVIDDAIVALKDEDREAIALRFFEKRSFAEVGAALHVTEEAGRKRVDRALDKLRTLLARRGVTSTASALGLTLAALALNPVPPALGAKVASHALVHGSAIGGGSMLGTIANALLPAAAVLVLGGFLIGSQRETNRELRAELARLAAVKDAITVVREENDQLSRAIAQASEMRLVQAVPPAPALEANDPPGAPRPVSARLSVSAAGTISWDGQYLRLENFIERLRWHQATADPESRVNIRGVGVQFSALAWVIDEVRKAQIKHVTIESNAALDPKVVGVGWWYGGVQ